MGYANHIGRVGALAVALGIGAAVATQPGIGWAQDGSSSNDSNSGSSSTSDSSGSQQQSDQSQSQDSSSSSPSGDPTPPASTDEQSGTTTTIGGGSAPDVTISSSGGSLPTGEDGDEDPADSGDIDVIESPEAGAGLPGTPPVGGESPAGQTPAPSGGESGESGSHDGTPAATNNESAQDNTGTTTNTQQDQGSGSGLRTQSNADDQDGDDAGQSFRTFSTFSALSTLDTQDVAPSVAPAQDPISALLAIPAAFINAAANIIISFFEPFVAPGGPFENAALFALLEVTRRQFGQSFANSTPNIGPDISLTVDEDSAGKSIGTLPATDVDGDTITYTVDPTDGPEHGTVTIADNVVTYKPTAGYVGADSFTLVGSDAGAGGHIHAPGQSHTDTAAVSITVQATGPNATPVANPDSYAAVAGTPLVKTAVEGVLHNDTDADAGDTLTAIIDDDVDHGTLTLNTDGSFTYTATAGYVGTDSFTYAADDGEARSANVTVTFNVTAAPVDAAPVAVADSATTPVNTSVNIDVLANDTDTDGGPKSIASVTQPADGTVVITGGGTGLTYIPTGSAGTNTFTYTLNGGSTATVTVTVTAAPVDAAPVAVADSATTPVNTSVNIDVLANDTDTDGGPKSIASVTQPADGTVVITGGGTGLTYIPTGSAGTNTFTYTLNGGSTATVTVTVTAAPVDAAPVAVADSATTPVNTSVNIDVLANDTDTDGGPKSIASVTQPADGTVVITGGGTGLTYIPTGSAGTNTFTYTLNGGSTATVTVTVTAAPVDAAPVAVADSATTPVNTSVNIDVLANDTDTDGGPKSIASVTQPADGTVVITGGGTGLTYIPTGSAGTNTFTYTLNGGSTATVTVTVTAAGPAQPPSVLGTASLPGTSLSTVVTGPNGVTYQTITKNYNTTSTTTSVYAIDPDHPTTPVAIVTDAAGEQRGGLVFGPNGTAYQTTFVYAQGSTQQQVHVIVINLNSPSANPPVVSINNAESGLFEPGVTVGPDGKAYQLSETNGTSSSILHLTMIDPAQPQSATTTDFVGAIRGNVVIAGGKTFVIYETPDSADYKTTVVQINSADLQHPTPVLDVNGQLTTPPSSNPFVASDGSIYLQTVSSTDGGHIRVIHPTDVAHPVIVDIPGGTPLGRAVEGPGGVVYVPVNTSAITGTFPNVAFTQTVKVYTFDAAHPGGTNVINVPGTTTRNPAVGADGRVYFTTSVLSSDFTTSSYYVNVVDPAHPASVVSVPLPAKPSDSTDIVVGADGKAYLTTTSFSGGVPTTHLAIIDPQSATPQIVDVAGDHTATLSGDVSVGPNGLVYLTTFTFPTTGSENTTHVTVIDPHVAGNPIIKTLDIAGTPVFNVVFDDDGVAYQTTNSFAGGTHVAVIGVATI